MCAVCLPVCAVCLPMALKPRVCGLPVLGYATLCCLPVRLLWAVLACLPCVRGQIKRAAIGCPVWCVLGYFGAVSTNQPAFNAACRNITGCWLPPALSWAIAPQLPACMQVLAHCCTVIPLAMAAYKAAPNCCPVLLYAAIRLPCVLALATCITWLALFAHVAGSVAVTHGAP